VETDDLPFSCHVFSIYFGTKLISSAMLDIHDFSRMLVLVCLSNLVKPKSDLNNLVIFPQQINAKEVWQRYECSVHTMANSNNDNVKSFTARQLLVWDVYTIP
jgi:hypothetical protein